MTSLPRQTDTSEILSKILPLIKAANTVPTAAQGEGERERVGGRRTAETFTGRCFPAKSKGGIPLIWMYSLEIQATRVSGLSLHLSSCGGTLIKTSLGKKGFLLA